MTHIGMMFPLYLIVFITINDRLNIKKIYSFAYSGYPYPCVMYTIQFYDHLIFLQISLIFVINRCWFIITSKFDNFPLRSVWNTSSVSIVYAQPSCLQGWNHLWKQTVQGCFISSFIININILGRLYHLICYVDRGIFVLIMSFIELHIKKA